MSKARETRERARRQTVFAALFLLAFVLVVVVCHALPSLFDILMFAPLQYY